MNIHERMPIKGQISISFKTENGTIFKLIESENVIVDTYANIVSSLLIQHYPIFETKKEKIIPLTTLPEVIDTIENESRISVMISPNLTWGITHLGIGNANFTSFKQNWMAIRPDGTDLTRSNMVNEFGRIFRSRASFIKFDETKAQFIESLTPTNAIEFEFDILPSYIQEIQSKLSDQLEEETGENLVYLTELGLFGGKVQTDKLPFAIKPDVFDENSNLIYPSNIIDPGYLFSYVSLENPIAINKFKTPITFSWKIIL